MTRNPWMKWYPGDWRADPLVRACDPVARYVWLEILGLMHEAEPYGHLVIGGRAMDYKTLSALIAVDIGEVRRAVKLLEARGVFTRTSEGVIMSRRMVRDEEKRKKLAENGRKGGNARVASIEQNQEDRQVLPKQNSSKGLAPEARSQNPESADTHVRAREATSSLGPKPPDRPAGYDVNEIERKLVAAAGTNLDRTSPSISVVRPILDLLAQGCDLDRHVIPAVRRVVPALRAPLRTWGAKFLSDAIREARDRDRASGWAPPDPDDPRVDFGGGFSAALSAIQAALDQGRWRDEWGPRVGEHGCRVPPELAERLQTAMAA